MKLRDYVKSQNHILGGKRVMEKIQIRIWNQEELQQFSSSIKEKEHEHLYSIAIHTAMRIGELLDLRWDYIDFDKMRIAIPTRATKGNEIRITEELFSVIMMQKMKQLSLFGDSAEEQTFVFTDARGRQLTYHQIKRDFQKITMEAQLPTIPISCLRHSVGVILLKNQVSIMFVSNFLKHHSIEATLKMYSRYL